MSSKAVWVVVLLTLALSVSGFRSCWATGQLSQPGEFAVGFRAGIPLEDTERGREIPVSVWHPAEGEAGVVIPDAPLADDGPYPLIVSAHGLGASPSSLGALHEHLASHGFIVAAPKFPGTFADPQTDLTNDIVEHPDDISLVIDAALGVNGQFPADLVDAADPHRVGMMGNSYGGLATYLTAFDRELRDPRIRIAITLAGGGGDLFKPLFYDFVDRPLPLLVIHGTADALVDFETVSGTVFQNANWPTLLLALEGGSHVGFNEGVPRIPGTHPDFLVCLLFPPVDPNDPAAGEAFEYLANRTPDTGIQIADIAPLPCTYGAQDRPSWMEPERQLELTKAGVLAFALSRFGERASTRLRAALFLHETFNAENADAHIDAKPFPLGRSGQSLVHRRRVGSRPGASPWAKAPR